MTTVMLLFNIISFVANELVLFTFSLFDDPTAASRGTSVLFLLFTDGFESKTELLPCIFLIISLAVWTIQLGRQLGTNKICFILKKYTLHVYIPRVICASF